jgi:hypothetical protein
MDDAVRTLVNVSVVPLTCTYEPMGWLTLLVLVALAATCACCCRRRAHKKPRRPKQKV